VVAELPFTVENVGDRTARRALVELRTSDGLEILSNGEARFDQLQDVAEGAFSLRATRPGEFPVTLETLGGAKRTAVREVISVSESSNAPETTARWIIGAVFVTAGLLLILRRLQPRRVG